MCSNGDTVGGGESGRVRQSSVSSARRDDAGQAVERITLPYEERMYREAGNIERIIAKESEEGRAAIDVSREFRGYDIESRGAREERHIEVKASSYPHLTDREYRVAREDGPMYWLYVVDGAAVYRVQDPARKCIVSGIETVETRWKLEGWRDKGDKTSL